MKTGSKSLIATIRGWFQRNKNKSIDRARVELPLSAELFNADQMERHGRTLALSHTLTHKPSPDMLLGRLADNEDTLVKACRILISTTTENNRITPAGEWLLDNFYLIEEQIRTTKRHLPKGYGRRLPVLAVGLSQGYPRVYDIALQAIAHGDGRWDPEVLNRFVSAYQSVTALSLGELWAIPIMLRLALIENLRRAGARIAADWTDRNLADGWADRMVEIAESDPKSLILVIADMARSDPPMTSAFVSELARRLQGHGAALALPLTWIEQRLAESSLTIEQLVQSENQQQAANQVSVSNSIASLRRLGEIDWREFVEAMSVVERTLRTDPAGTYSRMDFATRDRYRHVVERLARASLRPEEEVAAAAVHLAASAVDNAEGPLDKSLAPPPSMGEGVDERRSHVGFYLMGAGLERLEHAVDARLSVLETLRRLGSERPLLCYLGLIALITAGLTWSLLSQAGQAGMNAAWLVTLGVAAALGTSQLAVALVNWCAMLFVKPDPLPRMDFTRGVPSECCTLVVVPAMLGSASAVETLVEALEVRFLGNRDDYLHFALLTDFNDAPQEHTDEDAVLLELARERIEALNKRYPGGKGDIFFLFHRLRRWNEREQVWMGYERKRGKLGDLNALLRGDTQTRFSLIVGRTELLSNVKYVITLDTDTQLPRESARQYVGAMAHPLNRPRCDAVSQRVIEGYGILQPRIAEALPSPGPTLYAKLCGSEPGIDPYTRMVSDVYQDLFGEGSFIGKGIYDVDVFEQVLRHRFPENRILSHDLLEGCYLRSGLLSDVPLFEQSPASYLADARRRTRWIRGDWQLAGWLLPRVLNGGPRRVANPLSALSRWKLFDNLRRSLVPAALMLLLGLGWTVLPASSFWLGVVLAIVLLPSVAAFLMDLARKPAEALPRQHFTSTARVARWRFGHLALNLACLPHEAGYSIGAIARTIWRVAVSRRHLLEWTPSDQAGSGFRNTPVEWVRTMWMGPVAALAAGVVLGLSRPGSLLAAAPLLALWFVSPLIAWWLSRPFLRAEAKFDTAQTRFLHMTARKTWGFFETFVTANDHWLPPDNYQEAPVEALAHRTSPTNIGLALLASLTAYDFGYLSMGTLLERTANTLKTMSGLERYRGHFYNWYDTHTLQPLPPRYVSTVDSGNLAGHLLTLRQGLLALLDAPLLNSRYLDGLVDTLDVLTETATEPITAELDRFRQLLQDARFSFTTWSAASICLDGLCTAAEQVTGAYRHPDIGPDVGPAREWSQKLLLQCRAVRDEFALFEAAADDTVSPGNIMLRGIATRAQTDTAAIGRGLAEVRRHAAVRIASIETLAAQVFALAQMENDFLYDHASHLMAIGFNVDASRRDRSNYDLLSSEARLGIFVAIAQGQVPQESWFALGRLLIVADGEPILVSWSGSVFEYLMPLLVMPSYRDTLLDQTCRVAVRRQIEYGKERGVAWGISESGYNAVDAHRNYQYRAFGVPGLGLMRGLAEDLVIAPYATVMSLMVAPKEACNNLQRLAAEGAAGQYGFYEAIDFTASRVPRGSTSALVRSFMAHHQGMSLLALSYLLHDRPMQRRFEADPLFQATLLLLQERIPKPVASYSQVTQDSTPVVAPGQAEPSIRVFDDPDTPAPEVQLLSNGRYHVMLTQAGGGYSRWRDIAVTRWRQDGTSDNWGMFGYLHDVDIGAFWSTSYQPTAGRAEPFKAVFSEGHAEFTRSDFKIDTQTEIVVSPEDDIELRRLRIRNRSKIRRTIEFTSYGEVVLAPQAADQTHPAFSNLFVETELLPQQNAILATRRPRSENERPPWMCHLLNVYSDESSVISFETDRTRFIGRGRTPAAPRAMTEPGRLSGTAGAVLDPIVSIRCRIGLEPGASVTLDLVTGVTDTREHCVALIERYRDRRMANRAFGLAWTHSQVLLRQLNASEADAQLYAQLAGAIIYAGADRRAEPGILVSNRRGQSGLWGYSISGDLPIVLLHIEDAANIELVRQLIQAHSYWRQKCLAVDLVILNEERAGYRQALQDQVMGLMAVGTPINITDPAGGIFVRAAEQMPTEDRVLLQSVAHVILSDKHGTLAEQLDRRPVKPPAMPRLTAGPQPRRDTTQQLPPPPRDLRFFNGMGGFTQDGDEYVITLADGQTTPAPWVNVLANPTFGTVVSESGQSYTWTENAHEFRLTPWDNDPVQDSAGEAFYLRDEETGQFWSPTALPCRGRGEYDTRHGFGYSVFEHVEDGIHSELWMYVALDAPVKFAVLKVRNDSQRLRRLSATGYVEWVLGDLRSRTAMHVVTEMAGGGALLARNRYNTEFGERTAFFDAATSRLDPTTRTVTGDRVEFLGRNGTRLKPDALKRTRLSGRVGAGLDPCGAIQLAFYLSEGQTREIVFTLGVGQDGNDADGLARRFRGTNAAQDALAAIRRYWHRILSAVRVTTPDPAVDLLANGWLLYQTLSSRLWGRSGYYQSGGAFGFRDQLQDAMAMVHAEPQHLRAQLLLCAAHQFTEGDVQHWWHPPQGRGVRTRCSDDYLWLPFAICRYVETTGDVAVLDESVAFLHGRHLNADEESYYDLPTTGAERASLYQHGVRAILNGLQFGKHGLPLIGSGDWNDGMNLVGEHGKGESVWLGFFLYAVLKRFGMLAQRYGDTVFAKRCDAESNRLQRQIEQNGWDGEWYRRAYFDDGRPLGSVGNAECRIDSIAQSWSVLSGAGDAGRSRQAMAALDRHLVRRDAGLIQLLDPPFDKSTLNPGYIKGYVPGVRENGGQYTHGAIWAAMAFAELGDGELAWSLFNIINPINHGRTPEEIAVYRIEPYVVAADVYGVAPHTGRGGWSWYTGSAGWMYRLIIESLLGLRLEDGQLRLAPCLPAGWDGFTLDYRYRETVYRIDITQAHGGAGITFDGIELEGEIIPLQDDGRLHHVSLTISTGHQ